MYQMVIKCQSSTVLGTELPCQWEGLTVKHAMVRLKGAMRRASMVAVTTLRWMLHPPVRARMGLFSPRSFPRQSKRCLKQNLKK